MYIIREVYYGWSLRYIHSNGASFLFTVLFIHIGRGLYYGSYYYNSNSWFSGIIIFIILMAIAFIGYVFQVPVHHPSLPTYRNKSISSSIISFYHQHWIYF